MTPSIMRALAALLLSPHAAALLVGPPAARPALGSPRAAACASQITTGEVHGEGGAYVRLLA